ncbi:Cysteine/serine-rich nuclear protein 1 [Trichinella nelsoni]|uniref:Cysteine/serine-rich nuclear protein 1 n=1 Tax=Trichinella nelsoni TaxID=6336 RepID=A0A0V0RLZ5_9BILA|nr:Cysteine/serine-rich nuclear protein 1 [Trichinella nelsoni]
MDSSKLPNITSPLAKRSRKSSRHVHFGEVKTFKFGRAQGLCTVPEGGLALGMEDCCFEIETKELSDVVVENNSCYAQPRKFTLSERREILNMAEVSIDRDAINEALSIAKSRIVIGCHCKKGQCNTSRCSCFKNNISCYWLADESVCCCSEKCSNPNGRQSYKYPQKEMMELINKHNARLFSVENYSPDNSSLQDELNTRSRPYFFLKSSQAGEA